MCHNLSDGSHLVDLESYFLLQPVFHDWQSKGCKMIHVKNHYSKLVKVTYEVVAAGFFFVI